MVLETEGDHPDSPSGHPSEPVPVVEVPAPATLSDTLALGTIMSVEVPAPATLALGTIASDLVHQGEAHSRPYPSVAALDGAAELRAGGQMIRLSDDELQFGCLLRKSYRGRFESSSTEDEAGKARATVRARQIALEIQRTESRPIGRLVLGD
jgi:hypothetical protein